MKKERNTAEIIDSDNDFDSMELSKNTGQGRKLILKAAPRSRKGELMAKGAKEIRCIYCHQVKLLAGAEEFEGGWICGDCVPEMAQGQDMLQTDRTQLFGNQIRK